MDVEEGANGLDGPGVLRVVEEVALAGGVFGVPDEDVEGRVVGASGGRRVGWDGRWRVEGGGMRDGEGTGGARAVGWMGWVGGAHLWVGVEVSGVSRGVRRWSRHGKGEREKRVKVVVMGNFD